MPGPPAASEAQLIVRTLLFRALGPFAVELELDDAPLYTKVIADLEYFTSQAADDAQQLLHYVSDTMCTGLSGCSSASSAKAIKAIKRTVAAYDISPVNPYAEIFGHMLGETRRAYETYATWNGGDVGFMTVLHGGHPTKGARKFPVNALTDPPGGAGVNSSVQLHLGVPLLDLRTFAAIPYVLAHETVCHAGQGNGEVRNDSTFTEGWMDFVAELLHDDAVPSLPHPLLPEQHRAAARELIRIRSERSSGIEHWGQRSYGRSAASQLLGLFQRLDGTSPGRRLSSLSMRLNASPVPTTAKDHFVVGVTRAFETGESTKAVLAKTIRAWERRDGAVEELIDSTLKIR